MTNILIVEDDPMVQFIHRNYLEKLGTFETIYSSETIAEAKNCWQAVRFNSFFWIFA